jgi:hypothetical protein
LARARELVVQVVQIACDFPSSPDFPRNREGEPRTLAEGDAIGNSVVGFPPDFDPEASVDVKLHDDLMSLTSIQILSVLFLATFVRSTLGFGEALVAVPLLALFIPIKVAAPVAVLISITVATIALLQDWRHVHVRSAGWLVAATLVGTPLGLLLLTQVKDEAVKVCLGLFILGFSAYSLLQGTSAVLEDDRLAWPFGLLAGMLGGAYGMNGPPLVMYGRLRGWSPQRFRATLQGYFLPASTVSMGGYWLAGLWSAEVTRYYLMSLPGVVVATLLGRALNGRIDTRSFVRCVNIGLFLVAIMLLVQGLPGVP